MLTLFYLSFDTSSLLWNEHSYIKESCAHGWASECPDAKNYKWRFNPVWHRMYPYTATVVVKGLI